MPHRSVIYVGGWGRSGTTILDRTLGAHDGFVSVGELSNIWQRGLIDGTKCGCGRPVPDCPMWTEALDVAFGGRAPDAPRIEALRQRTLRIRHTARLLALGGRMGADPDVAEYVDIMDRMYRAVGEVNGARIVVDSSKRPPDALLVTLLPGSPGALLHMVRDPRAVAFSLQRRRPHNDPAAKAEMTRLSAGVSARSWLAWNATLELIGHRYGTGHRALLRYETFAAAPRTTTRRLIDGLGLTADSDPWVDEHRIQLRQNHTVSGNPGRFSSGPTLIRPDNEWQMKMPARDRRETTVLCAPMMLRYRYPLRMP